MEFEHFLSEKLSMTVADLRGRMDQAEFVSWQMYYARIAQRQELANG